MSRPPACIDGGDCIATTIQWNPWAPTLCPDRRRGPRFGRRLIM